MPNRFTVQAVLCFCFLTACARNGVQDSSTVLPAPTSPPATAVPELATRIPSLSPKAYRYLTNALDLMAKNSIKQKEIEWDALRAAAYQRAQGADKPSDTYAAIRSALSQLGDHHSLFFPPDAVRDLKQAGIADNPLPEVRLLQGKFAYVLLPGYRGIGQAEGDQYATELEQKIRDLDNQNPCGWIVDLRQDTGGNMWPMLAGIGPVLGEGRLGAFVDPDGEVAYWSFVNGEARQNDSMVTKVNGQAYQLREMFPPVAVLTSRFTASSGEAVVVAFRGRPNTRSFGEATAGLSTANREFELTDGAMIFLTVSTFADRTGRVYGSAISPDQVIEQRGSEPDLVLEGAIDWLHGQTGCALENMVEFEDASRQAQVPAVLSKTTYVVGTTCAGKVACRDLNRR